MKYRIVGADGRTYGPVELEPLRQWIAQGRADSRTPVLVESAANWSYLGLLPELATDFAAAPPRMAPLTPLPGTARTNGFATAGLICGLLSWICCCCLPLNLLGLIFSIIALVQINSQPQPQEGRAFAIVGLVLSAANLLFSLGFGLFELALSPTSVSWHVGSI